jgi:hypothetical protein
MSDNPERESSGNDSSNKLKGVLSRVLSVLGGEQGTGYKLDIPGSSVEDVVDSVSERTGVSIINLGRKYDFGDEPRLLVDAKGPLSDWRDRFERPGHVFNPGERVAVPAFIESDEDANPVLVADDQDGRMADRFYPLNLSGETRTILDRFKGVPLGCVLKVEGLKPTEFQISDIHEYHADLESEIIVPPINPTDEQLKNLPRGARVISEGKIIDLEVKEMETEFGTKTKYSLLTLEGEDGRKATIGNWADNLEYRGGVLENLDGKQLEPGEQVRIASYVGLGEKGSKILHSHYSKPFLLQPSPIKLKNYKLLRGEVEGMTTKMTGLLENHSWQEARRLFAEARTRELTIRESEALMASVAQFPEKEEPVFNGKRRLFWAESLDKTFGVRTEAFTRKELVEFAREVGTGKREQTGAHCDESYAFLLMHQSEIDSQETLSVLGDAVDGRLSRLEKVEDSHEASFGEHYMLEQSLSYMASVPLPEATEKILGVARYCMKNKLYDKRQDRQGEFNCPRKFLHLMWSATDDLARSIQEHPENLSAIKDLNELLAWQEELSQYPFCDTIVQDLQKVTDQFRL